MPRAQAKNVYYDVSGVRADGSITPLRRISTFHDVGEGYTNDPGSNAIDEVVFGSGFVKIRITLNSCFYLMGLGWKTGGCANAPATVPSSPAPAPSCTAPVYGTRSS